MQCTDTILRQKIYTTQNLRLTMHGPPVARLFSAAWAIFGPPGIFK